MISVCSFFLIKTVFWELFLFNNMLFTEKCKMICSEQLGILLIRKDLKPLYTILQMRMLRVLFELVHPNCLLDCIFKNAAFPKTYGV